MRRFLIFLATSVLSTHVISEGLMFRPAPGAMDPMHIALQSGVSEQDYYWVRAKYPAATAVDHYAQLLKGWHRCKTRKTGWESFADVSSGSPRFIHQQVLYWVSQADDAFVMLALRYESAGDSYRVRPDSDMQSVIVLRSRAFGASKHLSGLGATCDKNT